MLAIVVLLTIGSAGLVVTRPSATNTPPLRRVTAGQGIDGATRDMADESSGTSDPGGATPARSASASSVPVTSGSNTPRASGPSRSTSRSPSVPTSQAQIAAASDDRGVAHNYRFDAAHGGSTRDALAVTPSERWSDGIGGMTSFPIVAGGKVFATASSYPKGSGPFWSRLFALDVRTGDLAWGPIDLQTGSSEFFSGIAYENDRVFAVNAEGVLRAFNADDGSTLWTVKLYGQHAFSTPPTAYDGTVFVQGAGAGGTLYAVDEGTGTERWHQQVDQTTSGPPTVGDGRVYVTYGYGHDYAYDIKTGALIWHHAGRINGDTAYVPVFYRGRLYIRDPDDQSGDRVEDARTGEKISDFSAMFAPAFDGDSEYVVDRTGTLEARDLATNSVRWSLSGDEAPNCAPLVVNGNLFFSANNHDLYELRGSDGAVLWHSVNSGFWSAPAEGGSPLPLVALGEGEGTFIIPVVGGLLAFG